MSAETIINAIGALWKLVFALTFLIGLIVFRRPLVNLFERLTKLQLKRGQTELATEMLGIKVEKEAEVKSLSPVEEKAETKMLSGASIKEPAEQLGEPEPKDSNEPFLDMFKAAFETRSMTETEEAYKKLQETEAADEDRLANEAYYYYLRYELGDVSAITKLQDMTKAEKAAPYANNAIAFCYDVSGDYGKAGNYFEQAAQGYAKKDTAKGEERKIRCIIRAADCLHKAELKQAAYSKIMRAIAETTDQLSLSDLYAGLASLYEKAGETDLHALALEKAIEFKPNDINLRFSAGFSYAKEKSTHAISLLHYKTLLQFDDKHTSALNNIGVQYDRLQMTMKSVPFYKKAANLNETLAAANLANSYINAGFAEEANRLLDNAKQQPNIDPKVGEEIAHLAKKVEEENEAEEAQVKSAREQQRFLLSFGEAYFTSTTPHRDFEGGWTSPNGIQVTISVDENSIQADWVEDSLEERFTGKISNRAAKIKYEHVWAPTIKDSRFGYAYLSLDGKELHILIMGENITGLATHTIEILKKTQIESPPANDS
jgi:Flp pilus assembly protein TadD